MIAFLVARINGAFETRSAFPQARTAAGPFIELSPKTLKFVGGRFGEMQREFTLAGGQHADDEVPAAEECIGTAGLLANAPQDERRGQRDGGERIDGHALALAVWRTRRNEAYAGRKASQRLPECPCVGADGGIAGDDLPGVQKCVPAQY